MMTKESFANYQFVVTLIMLGSITALPGMQNVVIQSVARGFPGTYLAASRLSWRCSFLGLLCLAALSGLFATVENWELSAALCIAALLFPASNGIINWQSFQAGREKFRLTAKQQGTTLIIANGLIITLSVSGFSQPWCLIAVYFGTMAIQNILMTASLRASIDANSVPEPNAIPYGLRTSLYSVANTIGNYLDRVLLFFLIAPEALAIYAIADRFPELIKKNVQSLTHAIIPGLSRKQQYTPALNSKFNRAGLTIAGCILIFAFAVVPWLLPLAYTNEFTEAVVYCQILLLSICVGIFSTLKFSYIQAKMDERGFRNITLVMSGSRIAFSLIMVPFWGAMGAALSTVAYRLVTLGLVEYHLRRFHSGLDDHFSPTQAPKPPVELATQLPPKTSTLAQPPFPESHKA